MADDDSEEGIEPPAAFAETDERRMHVRAYNHWASLLRGRAFPSVADLHPARLDDFGPHSVLLDFTGDPEAPRLAFIGARLRAECGLDGHDIAVADVPPRSLISRLTDHYFEIIANRAPVGFEAEFESASGARTLYRGILMPLSSDGGEIDFLYGVINWKEVAAIDLRAAIEAELARVLPARPVSELPGRLATARAAAATAALAESRSHAALYRALGEAYDFHIAAQRDPAGYRALLDEAGIAAQDRAPMTAVAKLVFGADAAKARLTEYAAALAAAARAEVAAEGFESFVTVSGGLKALVASERRARTPSRPTAADPRPRLRAAPAAARVRVANDGGEFVLLVARREGDGSLAVLEAVPDAAKLLDAALAKLPAPCEAIARAA